MLTRRKRDKHDHLNKSSQPPHPRLKRCNSLKVATAQRYLAKKPHITSPCFGDLHQPCRMKDVFTPPLKTNISHQTGNSENHRLKSTFQRGICWFPKGKIWKTVRLLFVHPDPPAKRGSVKWEISPLSGRPHSEAWQLGTPAPMEVKKWTWSKVVYQSIKVVEDGHIPAQTNLMINGYAQWTIPRRKICQIPALQGPTSSHPFLVETNWDRHARCWCQSWYANHLL